jgi:hypothetical protein
MQQIGWIEIGGKEYKCLVRYHKEYVSLKLAKGKIDKNKMHNMTDEAYFLKEPEAQKSRDMFLSGKVISL